MRKWYLTLFSLLVVLSMAITLVTPALAAVRTDQADYAPGSVVTISGDNSDNAGYVAGETVSVDVVGPNGYAASFEAVADANGAWFGTVTLADDVSAVGSYNYTATGQTSGVSENGAFTDKIDTTLTVANASGPYGGTVDLSGNLTYKSGTSWLPLSGKTVSFLLNGTNVGSATTNASGIASLTGVSLDSIAPGTYNNGIHSSYDGDGTYKNAQGHGDLTVMAGAGSFSINDVTASEGNSGTTDFTFTVTLVRTADGNLTVDWATADGTATVVNNDYTAASGSLTWPGSTSGAKTLTVSVNGDTDVESDETFLVNLTAVSPGTFTLTDAQGLGTITNDDAAAATPIVTAPGSQTASEGASTSFNLGSFVDPDNGPWSVDVNWGDGSSDAPFVMGSAGTIPAQSHTYDDGLSTPTVTVTVTDSNSASGSASFTVTVNNVAPAAAFNAPASVNEGSDLDISLTSPSDPSSADTAAGFTYAFDLGSGVYEAFSSTSTASITPDDGPATVNVGGKIKDKDGGVTEYTATVTVNNVAPVVGTITAPIAPVQVNTPVNVSASFSDAGTKDTHTAMWDWEGSTSSGTVTEANGSGSVTGSKSYTTAGIYSIKLTVTDDDGGSSSSPVYDYVVVYDPSAGFVTGGGWITSPAGADRRPGNELLTGKANFGFVSKYLKGASKPTGNTEFQFHTGNLNFSSTSYDWLVVAGQKAMYKGIGTINGGGNYGFLLSAIDGGTKGTDKFRIKIWDKSNGDTVVYDNLLTAGAADDADPTTVLGGGNIVIQAGGPNK
jgi:hypothetical protein